MESYRNYKLGTTIKNKGINYAIFSKNATEVYLNVFEKENDNNPKQVYKLDPIDNKTGDIWHIYLEENEARKYYTWNIDGPLNEKKGHRFDKNIHLLDPYAKAYTEKKDGIIQKAVVVDTRCLNRKIQRPRTLLEETIIYELHVSLFTRNNNSAVSFPGTYKGIIEKIEYLKNLGITAVEILPIYEFDDYVPVINPLKGEKLKNVWGYNPISFFALSSKYFSGDRSLKDAYENQIKEFINLIDEFHKAGIEVILDVVYNHTAEGNDDGKIYNFKGQDNTIYYIMENENRSYANYSGCGNTFNCNHPVVKEMIINSLRYWYGKIGVDGFRFDLAAIMGRNEKGDWIGSENTILNDIAKDPVLSKAKLIGEGWDAGGGYYLDNFPKEFSIWNGKYRDCIRGFIKGEHGVVKELTTRIAGSPDIFKNCGKTPLNSLNFITAHDGFTMWDLVSYNNKQNIENGENNRDGESNNHSWNHGFEGETDNSEIIELRKRQIKNLFLILLLSEGIPMILMGDELGRTQKGNNNAYCQDSSLTWVDWERAEKFSEITYFLKKIIRFRKHNKLLKNREYSSNNFKIRFHGIKENRPDFTYYSQSLAVSFENNQCSPIYAAFNSYYEELEFELPYFDGREWYLVADTFRKGKDSYLKEHEKILQKKVIVKERSSVLLISKKIKN